MPEVITYFVGDRSPSISEVLTSGGVPVDLANPGSSVRFKARELSSSVLLVDQPVSNSPLLADGFVRYDWSANDVDPVFNGALVGGVLSRSRSGVLVWWEETQGGKKRTMNEAVISVLAHAPEALAYIELVEFKETAEMRGSTHADQDIRRALVSASRIVDFMTARRFWADADATKVRLYTPSRRGRVAIDDLLTLTSLKSAPAGTTYTDVWTLGTHFYLEPENAPADGRPWELIRVHRDSSLYLPYGYRSSVEVTGRFGWDGPPQGVKDAVSIIASRVITRGRSAPFGIVQVGAEGAAVRELGLDYDPELGALLGGYTRHDRKVLA